MKWLLDFWNRYWKYEPVDRVSNEKLQAVLGGDDVEILDEEYHFAPIEYYRKFKAMNLWKWRRYKLNIHDCLAEDTLILKSDLSMVPISDIKIGDMVYGLSGRPTRVLGHADKGMLPCKFLYLNNGCVVTATGDHRMFLYDGTEKRLQLLKEGDLLLKPSLLHYDGIDEYACDDWEFIGRYLSDGWIMKNQYGIAGRDGHPKEGQKRWVVDYCARHGCKSHSNFKQVNFHSPIDLKPLGRHAKNKHLVTFPSSQENIRSLIKGLAVDGSITNTGVLIHNTTSETLALQTRIFYRLLGISTSVRYHQNHGGLGKNPIYHIIPRMQRDRVCKIVSIIDGGVHHVYDITTQDGGIYLPQSDIIVHNCDNYAFELFATVRYLSPLLPFGIAIVNTPNGKHALNFFMITTNRFRYTFYFYEPQNDNIFELDSAAAKGYSILKLIV